MNYLYGNYYWQVPAVLIGENTQKLHRIKTLNLEKHVLAKATAHKRSTNMANYSWQVPVQSVRRYENCTGPKARTP